MNKLVREAKNGQRVPIERCIKLGRSYYLKEDYSKAMLEKTHHKIFGKTDKKEKK